MKKISLFLLSATLILLTSCGHSDEEQAKADAEKAKQDSIAEVSKRDSLFNAAAATMTDTVETADTTKK